MNQVTDALGKPNPRARIGFVVHYPFHFYVYKNIYLELRNDSEFIVDLCHPFPPEQQQVLLDSIVTLLERNHVAYRILHREDYYFPRYLERFFGKYKGLVSVWEIGCMQLSSTAKLKKINATYGAGKELTMVRPSKGIFDLVLSYGPRDTTSFSYYTHAEMVGNPKFDDWFSNSLDKKIISELRDRLDSTKKTILYLPTHSDLSSIDELVGELAKLTRLYNVLIKTHYYTTHEEPGRIEKLQRTRALVFDDGTDLLPLLKVSDVVVSDNSSAIFDAILADKPVVVADFWNEEFLDLQHKEIRRYTRGIQGALTYSDSIEQVIKREGKVLTLKRVGELAAKIREALRDDLRLKRARAQLRKELFAFNDGQCAERAARAIHACLSDTETASRPILFHAIEAYKRRIGLLSYQREGLLNEKLSSYERALSEKVQKEEHGVVFSVLLLDAGGNLESRNLALRSLVEQNFPAEKFEIIAVGMSQNELEDTLRSFPHDDIPLIIPTQVAAEHVSLGERVQDAIKKARGHIVCFAADDCRVPFGWLSSLYLAYRRHPDARGVGGYVQAAKEHHTVFDEYYYYRLAKCLDVHRERAFLSKLYEVKNSLFYQNPAGDLRNMSYKKDEIFGDVSHIQNLQELELYLKIHITSRAPLCFVPLALTRQSVITKRDFMRGEHARGFFHRVAKPAIARNWSYRSQSLASAFAEAISVAAHTRDMILGIAVFIGFFSRWVGKMRASARNLNNIGVWFTRETQ